MEVDPRRELRVKRSFKALEEPQKEHNNNNQKRTISVNKGEVVREAAETESCS